MAKKKNTWLLAGALLLLFAAGYGIWQYFLPDTGAYAVVQVDGETAARLPLGKDTEFLVGDRDGDYNLIQVKDGAVSVTEANCADEICVKTGEIRTPGELIACLPHGLIVYVEGD